MARAGILIVLALLFSLPLRAQHVVAEPFPPAKFLNLYIERDEKGAIISVQLQGDALIYRTTLEGKELENVTLHPTDDDWFKFVQALNAAKVYTWSPKYYYPGQGPSWVVDFDMKDRQFNSSGTNEFPKAGDEANGQANPASGPSVPFQLFWQAAMTLVGKNPQPASK